ncbi:MAG: arginine--tRNA ligase [Candidatus Aenigmarchaeota archaeon]|nr:arginine--tRNA ligase [Candidatus Aenigmarchaeota archaeon]
MESVKSEIMKALEKAGVKNPKVEKPPESIDADLSLPCFELAKEMKKSPVEIAKELAGKLKPKNVKVKPLGPYVNFYIDWERVGQDLLEKILKEKEKYGSAKIKENVIMDVYQANPFKSFHIGHIRNAVFGESVRRLLEFTGRKTTTVTYNGDVGVHVARWLWYYNNFYKGSVPKENFAKWVGQIYAESSKKIAEDKKYEDEMNEVNRKMDKRDPKLMEEWKKFRKLCYVDYEKIAKELQVKVDHNIPESECEEPGKSKVKELHKQGKLVESEGAIGIDLKNYGLGFFILLKSDGTALYSTKDLGLRQLKSKLGEFGKYLYVVGSEQDLYFQQLFKAYELLGFSHGEHHHLSHGLVTLKEGKMSSRLGNVILYEDLRDEMVKMSLEQIEQKNPDLKNKQDVARQVAFAAIKFQMLCIENHKFIKFDWDQALDINGRSGPYLQYTTVRANKILDKENPPVKFDASLLKDKQEIELLKKLAEFSEAVKKSADAYSPYILTTYLFELSQNFNAFYQSSPVLQAETKLKQARLALVKSVSIVLKTGLNLLGIEVPEEM